MIILFWAMETIANTHYEIQTKSIGQHVVVGSGQRNVIRLSNDSTKEPHFVDVP